MYFQEHLAREADPIATGLISSLNIIVPNIAIPPRKLTRCSTKSLKWVNKMTMSIVSIPAGMQTLSRRPPGTRKGPSPPHRTPGHEN